MTDRIPKALLFDLDETILAFEVLSDGLWRRLSAKYAPTINSLTSDQMHNGIKEHSHWYWSDPERHRKGRLNLDVAHVLISGAFRRLGVSAPCLAIEMAEEFSALRSATAYIFPGALDILKDLGEKGVRLALITNGNAHRQREKVAKHGLESLFDHILIEGEFGVGKPDERVYLHALEQLDSSPADAWMVGDNLEWDVAAPQRLGIVGIWVDTRGEGVPKWSTVQPDRIIRSVRELP